MSASHIEQGLDELAEIARASKGLSDRVARVASRYADVLRRGGTLYFCGNGGSAADAQHLAAFIDSKPRPAYPFKDRDYLTEKLPVDSVYYPPRE